MGRKAWVCSRKCLKNFFSDGSDWLDFETLLIVKSEVLYWLENAIRIADIEDGGNLVLFTKSLATWTTTEPAEDFFEFTKKLDEGYVSQINSMPTTNINSIVQYLDPEIGAILPKTSESVYKTLEVNIPVSEDVANVFYEDLSQVYENNGVPNLLKMALNYPRISQRFLADIRNSDTIWAEESWVADLSSTAQSILRAANLPEAQANTRNEHSRYFSNIPIEGTHYNPDYTYLSGTVRDGYCTFASNGVIALQNEGLPISTTETTKKLLAILPKEVNKIYCFNLHFIPNDNAFFVETDRFSVLRMGAIGLRNFVNFCEESGVPDETLVFGTTNLRMANIAVRLGFTTSYRDPQELKNIGNQNNNETTAVASTVGMIKSSINSPVIAKLLRTATSHK